MLKMRLKCGDERRQKGFIGGLDLPEIQKGLESIRFDLAARAESQAQRVDKRDCEQ